MRLPLLAAIVIAISLVAPACGDPATSGQPAAGKPLPAKEKPLSLSDKILIEMERSGAKVKTLEADFDYEMNQTLLEDIQKRKGKVWYKTPNLFRLGFTTPTKDTYVFDGRRLYEKRESAKQLIIYEVRRADEKAVESLAIGRSPFPMPFGQKADTVKKHFVVTLDESDKKVPKGQQVLLLVPKKKSPLAKEYTKMRFWVDTKTWLPVKIVSTDRSENILTVVFRKTVVNKKVEDKMFARPRVPGDWEVIEHLKPKEEPEADKKTTKTDKKPAD